MNITPNTARLWLEENYPMDQISLDTNLFKYHEQGPLLRHEVLDKLLNIVKRYEPFGTIVDAFIVGPVLTLNWTAISPIEIIIVLSPYDLNYPTDPYRFGAFYIGQHPIEITVKTPKEFDADEYELLYELTEDEWILPRVPAYES